MAKNDHGNVHKPKDQLVWITVKGSGNIRSYKFYGVTSGHSSLTVEPVPDRLNEH